MTKKPLPELWIVAIQFSYGLFWDMTPTQVWTRGLITWDRHEFRPLPKWKFSEVFTRDWNETEALFLQIFHAAFRIFCSSNNVFLVLCLINDWSGEISRFYEENFVSVRIRTGRNSFVSAQHPKWVRPVRAYFSDRSHVNKSKDLYGERSQLVQVWLRTGLV